MTVPMLLFLFGLVLLIKGGDWFVDGATGLAKRFRVPELLIGATIVSIGTTLPEVMVSATSAVQGHGEIAYGNAVGSIICNTALIAALTITIRPAPVSRASFGVPVLFFFAAAAYYSFVAYTTGFFTRAVGVVLLCLFAVYMVFTIFRATRMPPVLQSEEDHAEAEAEAGPGKLWKDLLLLAVGAVLIALGADLLVDNGTLIAQAMGVPESVIALTFVALGTSLPELVTAITSLIKGHGALSLGNIVGANLFNLVLVSGVATVLSPFGIPTGKTLFGYNASLVVDLPLMVFVMVFMTLPALVRGRLSRWQGVVLLCVYAGFCVFQFFL